MSEQLFLFLSSSSVLRCVVSAGDTINFGSRVTRFVGGQQYVSESQLYRLACPFLGSILPEFGNLPLGWASVTCNGVQIGLGNSVSLAKTGKMVIMGIATIAIPDFFCSFIVLIVSFHFDKLVVKSHD